MKISFLLTIFSIILFSFQKVLEAELVVGVNNEGKTEELKYSHFKHRVIYIDLGANDGVSVQNFAKRILNNTFLPGNIAYDGSKVAGSGFGKIDHLNIPDVSQYFHIIAVEANPRYTAKLQSYKDTVLKNKFAQSYTLYNGTAISIADGTTEFIFDGGDGNAGATMNKYTTLV